MMKNSIVLISGLLLLCTSGIQSKDEKQKESEQNTVDNTVETDYADYEGDYTVDTAAFKEDLVGPLSLTRYYANLPEDHIHGHCFIRPNAPTRIQNITGNIDFRQSLRGGPTEVSVSIQGFNTKDNITLHGIHIDEYGDLSDGCGTAGGHYNPFGVVHGSPEDSPEYRHFGDLGNIKEGNNGRITTIFKDYLVSLLGPFSILGRAVVISEKLDDQGRGQNEASLKDGNSGTRLACCTIGLSDGARWRPSA